MKFLFIGCGSICLRHIRLLKDLAPGADISAYRITSRNADLLEKLEVKSYSSLEDALKGKPDAVFVTNPTSIHAETILKIKGKAKSIFVEKPLSHNLENVHELKSLDNTFLIGYVLRYHPVLKKVKELLDNGAIGRPIFGEASVGQFLPTWRPGVDYRDSHSAKKKFGGGAILELSHELDYLHWLLGWPSEVFCRAGKFSDLEIETEDMAEIVLSYGKKSLARVHLDFLQRKASRTGKVVGSKGDLIFNILEGKVELNGETSEMFNFDVERDDMYRAQLEHFIDVIEGKSEPLVTLEDGISALRLAVAAKESATKNMPVQLEERE